MHNGCWQSWANNHFIISIGVEDERSHSNTQVNVDLTKPIRNFTIFKLQINHIKQIKWVNLIESAGFSEITESIKTCFTEGSFIVDLEPHSGYTLGSLEQKQNRN